MLAKSAPLLSEPYVDKRALAAFFAVGVRTVERWMEHGAPVHRFGGSVRFRVSEVEQWHQP